MVKTHKSKKNGSQGNCVGSEESRAVFSSKDTDAIKNNKDKANEDSKANKNNKANKIDILLVNSDNANFPKQKAFLDNPNEYLTKYKPQVVLVSPCVQSGVSIEVNYVDKCFGSYSGTVSPVVFAQMLHRVRSQRVFALAL